MHNGMKLEDMLAEVVRHSKTKRDFIADTKENLAMVNMPNQGFANDLAVVLQNDETSELERFEITDNFHKQVAMKLKVPSKYYFRLLEDHRELLLENVNQLFEREPALRMIRTLDNRARAFLSNSFRRVDNEQILERTLPVIKGDFETKLLNTYVDENRLRMKCLFTGPEHEVDLGETPNGRSDTVHAGFEMGNSEVGKGSYFLRGFLYRGYCLNGCVWGEKETASYRQIHVGSRLGIDASMLLSNETMQKEDELIVSASRDVLRHLSSPEFTQQIGVKLRALKDRAPVKSAAGAVESVCKELRMSETESASVLESFIKDQDYSQWGMVNAVTQVANGVESYNRSSQIEELGSKVINLNAMQWNRIANLEAVAVAA